MKHISLEEAKDQLCHQAWELNEPCDPALLTSLYHSATYQQPKEDDIFSSSGPFLYIVFVALFYLCVVGVLVGTNMRKKGEDNETEERVQMIQFTENSGVTTSIVDPAAMEEEDCGLADPV